MGMTPTDSGTTQSLHPYAGSQTVPAGPAVAGPPDPPMGNGNQAVADAPPAEAPPVDAPPVEAPPVDEDSPENLPVEARPVAVGTEENADPGAERKADPRVEGRRQVRAARKRRRRISIVCAVLIALCTALTLLIVAIARTHTPDPMVVSPTAMAVTAPGVGHQAVPVIESAQTLGAPAPQGGHR